MSIRAISIIAILTGAIIPAYCQSSDSLRKPAISEDPVWIQVEQMPEFPGGTAEMLKYLNACPYPAAAKETRTEGTVFVKFVIDPGGEVTKVALAKDADSLLADAAIACISQMPDWKPGKQNGKFVSVQFTVPVKFIFREEEVKPEKKGKK